MKLFKKNILFVLILNIPCNSNSGQNNHLQKISVAAATPETNTIAGNFSNQQTIKFDSTKINAFFKKFSILSSIKIELNSFYRNRHNAFAWLDNKDMIELAGNFYNYIQNISKEGVKDKSPYQTEFALMMGVNNADSLNVATEIMLTAQYFVYAKNVWASLNANETKGINWCLPRKKIA